MSRRRRRDHAGEPALPVAELPERLQIFEPGDWLPDDALPAPVNGYDVAAWEAFEAVQHEAYQRFNDARTRWYATHRLPPLVVDELPADDEHYVPPPRKVARTI